jgi:hypothetical protein
MTFVIINHLKESMLLQLLMGIVFFRKVKEFNALKLLKTLAAFSRKVYERLPASHIQRPAMSNCYFVFAVSSKIGNILSHPALDNTTVGVMRLLTLP